jgi:Family of unknown function (DUF5681)
LFPPLITLLFAGEKQMSKFKPGRSGNPKGRPRGAKGRATELRTKIVAEIPDIVDQLITAAKAGDMQAARILIERAIPTLRPEEARVLVALPEDAPLSEQGAAVLRAVADGHITPSQGASMVQSLTGLARIIEVSELEARIAALERSKEQQ